MLDCNFNHRTFPLDPTDVNGINKLVPHHDSAGFYLGGKEYLGTPQNTIMVDAGLIWDYRTFNADNRVINPGYSAFILAGTETDPRFWDSSGITWYVWRSPGNHYYLDFEVDTSGRASLNVAGLGVFYWSALSPATEIDTSPKTRTPPSTVDPTIIAWPDISSVQGSSTTPSLVPYNPAYVNSVALKRVVAMNRRKPADATPNYDDGSYMYANVTNCACAKVGERGMHPWTKADVDQSITGYDSPANGTPLAKDKLIHTRTGYAFTATKTSSAKADGPSYYRVNFPYVLSSPQVPTDLDNARLPDVSEGAAGPSYNSASMTSAGVDRYTQEYVEIWLRNVISTTMHRVGHHGRVR